MSNTNASGADAQAAGRSRVLNAIEHADTFPYDAPDVWWRDTKGAPPPTHEDDHHRAARAVVAYMRSAGNILGSPVRRSEEARRKIVEDLAAIIRGITTLPIVPNLALSQATKDDSHG